MEKYLKIFEIAFNNGVSDYELEEIIDEAANEIEDNNEYEKFYATAINMLKIN